MGRSLLQALMGASFGAPAWTTQAAFAHPCAPGPAAPAAAAAAPPAPAAAAMVLKWGILGSGRIAKDFACSMMAVEGSECVAVASRRPSEALTAFAASFGCRAHASYTDLAADAEVEAVYVATIHPTHYALAKMSLEAGKHCMVEKPFAMNAREAAELAALAESKGLFLMEAMWTACLPATIEALRMVAAGEIGELQSASASVGGVWYSEDDLANEAERAAAKALGSGVLLDVGCYAIAAAGGAGAAGAGAAGAAGPGAESEREGAIQ